MPSAQYPSSYNRYKSELDVIQSSLYDKQKDVFAPGPDGRVAIRVIEEGCYLGGPVNCDADLAAIPNPIVGEFHFVICRCTFAVFNGTDWCIIGGGVKTICEGDAIDVSQNGDWSVVTAEENVCIRVRYDEDRGLSVDPATNELYVKTDGCSVGFNSNGELEADRMLPITDTEVDDCCRVKKVTYYDSCSNSSIVMEITYGDGFLQMSVPGDPSIAPLQMQYGGTNFSFI